MFNGDPGVNVFKPGILVSLFIFTFSLPLSGTTTIKVGVYQNKPKVFIDDQGIPRGMFVDIIEYIAAIEDWQIEYIEGTWRDGLQRLERGDIDLMPDVAFSREREERFDFHKQSLLNNWAQLYVPEGWEIEDVSELSGKRIGVLKDDISYHNFKQMLAQLGIQVAFREVDEFRKIFELLDSKEIEAGLISRLFGAQFEHQHRVTRSPVICCPVKLFFAAPKAKNTFLLDAIDKHLVQLKSDKNSLYFQSQDKWLGLAYTTKERIPTWIWWVLGIVATIAVFYFLIHLEMGRRINAMNSEVREKNEELLRHKEHLEELVEKRTKSLSESESKYRLITENASDVIWTMNTEGTYLYVSPSVERARGYKPEEVIGRSLESTLTPTSAAFVKKVIKELLESENPEEYVRRNQRIEIEQPHKDGGTIWSEVMTAPIFDDNRNIIGFQGVTRDITDRKKAEQALLLTNQKLIEANRELKETQAQLIQSEKMASLGQLTAGIAHEINNPVNYVYTSVLPLSRDMEEIKTFVDKCLQFADGSDANITMEDLKTCAVDLDIDYVFEEVFSLVTGIREGANRTKEIVEGLRNFSRLDADTLKPADIHEGIDATLKLLHNQIKHQVRIHKSYSDLPPIDCYPGKLNQVFMNILLNALQAIAHDGDIHIKTWSDAVYVYISIRDSGKGIPADIQSRIFEPFFTTKEIGQGTGLGLSVSYGIIEQHKGNIRVKSKVNEGTEFIVSIPLNLAQKMKA